MDSVTTKGSAGIFPVWLPAIWSVLAFWSLGFQSGPIAWIGRLFALAGGISFAMYLRQPRGGGRFAILIRGSYWLGAIVLAGVALQCSTTAGSSTLAFGALVTGVAIERFNVGRFRPEH